MGAQTTLCYSYVGSCLNDLQDETKWVLSASSCNTLYSIHLPDCKATLSAPSIEDILGRRGSSFIQRRKTFEFFLTHLRRHDALRQVHLYKHNVLKNILLKSVHLYRTSQNMNLAIMDKHNKLDETIVKKESADIIEKVSLKSKSHP